MTIFRWERRPGAPLPKRWQEWWTTATTMAEGTQMQEILATMLRGGEWICSDDTVLKVLPIFRKYPGWEPTDPLDNTGPPLTYGPLSPAEEVQALLNCPPALRAEFKAECVCAPDAPRSVRREADRAWRKWIELKVKQQEKKG